MIGSLGRSGKGSKLSTNLFDAGHRGRHASQPWHVPRTAISESVLMLESILATLLRRRRSRAAAGTGACPPASVEFIDR